jgi:hypothetical protein
MLKGNAYSLEDFHQDTPSYDEFCTHINNFRPKPPSNPTQYAQAMNTLLLHGPINRYDRNISEDILSMLHSAHRYGFIELDEDDWYTFPSPLSQHVWSWQLLPLSNYQLPFHDLFSFVVAIASYFKPEQLTGSDRRVGASRYRSPETQYQEECYRCVHKITHGNVRISPEYAAATEARPGRIDFFIPSEKWGIELTRDGDRLGEHDYRFADDGAYRQWLQTLNLEDYILLDFCDTKPTQTHLGEEVVAMSFSLIGAD